MAGAKDAVAGAVAGAKDAVASAVEEVKGDKEHTYATILDLIQRKNNTSIIEEAFNAAIDSGLIADLAAAANTSTTVATVFLPRDEELELDTATVEALLADPVRGPAGRGGRAGHGQGPCARFAGTGARALLAPRPRPARPPRPPLGPLSAPRHCRPSWLTPSSTTLCWARR